VSQTLFITILIEGIIVIVYARWRAKPVVRLILASVLANLLTQSLLLMALYLFPTHYMVTIFTAEGLIWLMESAIFYYFPGTRIVLIEALLLSLVINLSSFGIGLFLPV
jgi:hypothetical protein